MSPLSRSLICLLSAQVGLLGCRAVEEPEHNDEPVQPRSSPLRISTEPSDVGIRLPDFAKVARDVGPSVVGVISTIENQAGRLKGIGSGMIVSVYGEIVTNEHAIRHASEIKVQLA